MARINSFVNMNKPLVIGASSIVVAGGFKRWDNESRLSSLLIAFQKQLECLQPEVVMCETTQMIEETHPSGDSGNEELTRSSLNHLPELIRPLFSLLCWSVILSIWVAAGFGPIYLIFTLVNQAWSSALTFFCVWLLGGFLTFPEFPWLAHQIANGLEYWFPFFAIKYEGQKFRTGSDANAVQRTMYCYHPHGLFSIGAALLAADLIRRGEKVAFVTSSHMRWFNPLAKIMMDLAGIEIVGATATEVQAAMRKGERSLILVPGGYEEAVFTQKGFERLFLKTRLGFVKYAMRYGYTLTPVYAYGENDLYACISIASRLRDWFAAYKIPLMVFYGHSAMPLMPNRTPLKIIVGEPVVVRRIQEPSSPQLHDAHTKYVETLSDLYYRYNEYPDRPLEIT